jgi:hypothetical protein
MNVKQHAEKLFREHPPHGFDIERTRLEVLANGTLLIFRKEEDGPDPVTLLKENASCEDRVPVLVDPENGCAVRRHILAFKEWRKPGGLDKLSQKDPGNEVVIDHGRLKLLRGVPPAVNQYRYGRSGRLSLLFDRPHALVAAKVFPPNLVDAKLLDSQLIGSAARLMLARSVVSSKGYHFHMLRTEHFFGVERAARIPEEISQEGLRGLENDLIKCAEDDREIFLAMLSCGMPLGLRRDGRITLIKRGVDNHDGKCFKSGIDGTAGSTDGSRGYAEN